MRSLLAPICCAAHIQFFARCNIIHLNDKKANRDAVVFALQWGAMQYVEDFFDSGSVVAAWLRPGTLDGLDPVLRRLMCGQQLFVKRPDGTYRPRGSELGLARYFDFADLQAPALRETRI